MTNDFKAPITSEMFEKSLDQIRLVCQNAHGRIQEGGDRGSGPPLKNH